MFKQKETYLPVKPRGHDGAGSEGRIAFSIAERTWEESFDLMELLGIALEQSEYKSRRRRDWLVINNDLYLRPEIVLIQPLEPSGVRTVTTISIAHEKYVPGGLFEYQHASGDDTYSAFVAGFKGWVELDLPVLLDAVNNS